MTSDMMRPNFKIIPDASNPLITTSTPSPIIKYLPFTSQQTDTVIWTPALGKSIYLTGFIISSAGDVDVQLENSLNSFITWCKIHLRIGTLLNFQITFAIPLKFNVDAAIALTTSANIDLSISLFGYEKKE